MEFTELREQRVFVPNHILTPHLRKALHVSFSLVGGRVEERSHNSTYYLFVLILKPFIVSTLIIYLLKGECSGICMGVQGLKNSFWASTMGSVLVGIQKCYACSPPARSKVILDTRIWALGWDDAVPMSPSLGGWEPSEPRGRMNCLGESRQSPEKRYRSWVLGSPRSEPRRKSSHPQGEVPQGDQGHRRQSHWMIRQTT